MKAGEVFTPGSLPQYTYNERAELNLEWKLLDSIETKGFISSVSGPSKSGKTVLCETVIGKRKMLLVTGGGMSSGAIFWQKLRSRLGLPLQWTESKSRGVETGIGATASAGIQIPLVAKGGGAIQGSLTGSSGTEESRQYAGPDGVELLEYIASKGITLVVDDFHYIERSVQKSLAEQFKEAARAGASIVVVSVSHRSDESIRANPDLRGRVVTIDIPYWKPQELRVIAEKGFPLLNVRPDVSLVDRLVAESVSSPQLMQALCLQLCHDARIESALRESTQLNLSVQQKEALFRNATSLANCKTAFDIIITGPKSRGSERRMYRLRDGKTGDVYSVILKALAFGDPLLTLPYAVIKARVDDVVPVDPPRGIGIIQALQQMGKAVKEKLGEDRVLEWDEEKEMLNIPDP